MGSTIPSIRRARARIAQKTQSTQIGIRLFDDERKTLEERARSANKSLSAFVRDTLLSPIVNQCPANSESVPHSEETLFNSNEDGAEQTFVHKSAENDSVGEKFSKQVPSVAGGKDLASERTGHARGCACFACERLRAMIASQSCDNRGKTAKSKRINES